MSALEPEIVEAGTLPPGECIFTGTRGPLIDTKRNIPLADPRGYIAVAYVEELGKLCGMVSEKEVAELEETVEELENQLRDLTQIVKAAGRTLQI